MSRRNGSSGAAETTAAVFGQVLKHCREVAGLTQAELAELVLCDRSVITKVERGSHVPREDFAASCDRELKTNGLLETLWDRINWYPPSTEHPDWFRRRAAMDAVAVSVREYQSGVIPGLLQSEDYARTLFRRAATGSESLEKVEERVHARLSRQVRFLAPGGPLLSVILDESALRRSIGGPAVMRGQLEHLLNVGALPNVRIQVATFADELVTPNTPISLIVLPDGHRWLYSESAERGHLVEDPAVFSRHERTYDLLRADSLSARDSAALIRAAMEGNDHDNSRSERRPLAQEQSLWRQRRQLRRSGPRIPPRRRARP